jgi:hypothetical protein
VVVVRVCAVVGVCLCCSGCDSVSVLWWVCVFVLRKLSKFAFSVEVSQLTRKFFKLTFCFGVYIV